MDKPIKKKVVTVGNSLGVTLPKFWLEQNDVKPGSKVLITFQVVKDEGAAFGILAHSVADLDTAVLAAAF